MGHASREGREAPRPFPGAAALPCGLRLRQPGLVTEARSPRGTRITLPPSARDALHKWPLESAARPRVRMRRVSVGALALPALTQAPSCETQVQVSRRARPQFGVSYQPLLSQSLRLVLLTQSSLSWSLPRVLSQAGQRLGPSGKTSGGPFSPAHLVRLDTPTPSLSPSRALKAGVRWAAKDRMA